MHRTEAERCGSLDENVGVADGVCREESGSGRETPEGTPNREGEESNGPNAGIWNGRTLVFETVKVIVVVSLGAKSAQA